MDGSNAWAAVVAATITGVFAWAVNRLSKGYDARGAAEAALIGTGPVIIAEQNLRINGLQTEMSRLWDQLREALDREQRCQRDLAECMFKLKDVEQKMIAVEYQLRRLDPKFPPLEPHQE